MAELLHFPGRTVTDDAPARAAALDILTSCIVEAPAGSGKTGLLVQRYLKLLGDPSVEAPEEVLAITFTRKATAELQERVFKELHAAHLGHALPPDARPFDVETRALAAAALARGWALLDQPQRLNIRSIDSVSAGIANALPLLSGAGGPHRPIDDATVLYRQAARRTLLQLGGDDRPLHTALHELLLHRDGNLADCEALLAEMLATREQWGELVPLGAHLDDGLLDRDVRPRLEAALEAVVCSGLTRALDLMPPGLLQDLTTLAAELGAMPPWKEKPPRLSICADKHLPPAAKADHLDHWLALIHLVLIGGGTWRRSIDRGSIGHDFDLKRDKPRIEALIARIIAHPQSTQLQQALCGVRELPPAAYPNDQWRIARALFRVLSHALVELKLLFAEHGECDFSELSLNARAALQREFETSSTADASGAALTSGSRLRHLLVDEMQDTSSAQYTLLELLTRSWDGHSQTLFLVGDPKQSIYLFRQARVERFLRVMRDSRLGDIPLVPLRLTANFRSQATLVAAFNDTFEQLFPALATAAPDEVPFVPADAKRPPNPGPALHWHPTILGEHADDPGLPLTGDATWNHRRHEARNVCRIITNFLAHSPHPNTDVSSRPTNGSGEIPALTPADPTPTPSAPPTNPAPKRIAVLVRSRSHLQHIVAELDRLHLPYRAVDIDALNERPEVLDALALTRALLHPADRTAWLAVLHAPWCGLGLGDLLILTGEGTSPTPAAPPSPSAEASPSGAPPSPTVSSSVRVGPPPEADPDATLPTLVQTRNHLLSPDAQLRLARAWPVLEAALATLGASPIALHVERTWRSLGGDAWLTPEQQTNVLRYLDLLDKTAAEDNSRVNLDLLTARLGKLFAEPRAGAPQIELLTIHNAKGLEWDLVLVPGLERPPRGSRGVLLDWLELDSAGEPVLLLAPIQPRGDDVDPLTAWLRSMRDHRERAEERRLVYVAATRAREQLHLFGAVARNLKSGTLTQPRSKTLLHACWPVAEPLFAAFAAPAAAPSPFPEELSPPDDPSHYEDYAPLALAAAAAPAPPPLLQRLPLDFHPTQRFTQSPRLDYPTAASLRRADPFVRPEGSFAARAFGNVVHRYLQLLAELITKDRTCHPEAQPKDLLLEAASNASAADTLLAELPTWLPRLTASLRGEGLAPTLAAAEAKRALDALTRTLTDPTGRWILAPHPAAASEQALSTPHGGLRADRTFLAGPTPGSSGDTHLWIIDFKTTEQGSRPDEAFTAAEIQKYRPQLEAYANLRRTLPNGDLPLHLALYYPLIPRLITWLSEKS